MCQPCQGFAAAWIGPHISGSFLMRAFFAGILLASTLLATPVLSPSVLAQQTPPKSFVREDLASSGIRLEETFRKGTPAAWQNRQAGQVRLEARTAFANDPRRAFSLYAIAVALDGKSAASWLGVAQSALKIEPAHGGERYTLRDRAITASYMAYQVANAKSEEAAALALLGEAYASGEMWKQSLAAYRASLQHQDVPAVRNVYQDLREKYGFRVNEETAYKVDSDAANPRLCFQFTEALQPKTDYAPYISIAGAEKPAIAVEGTQLCVDGLKHGERYAVVLRQGLPSSVGENLLKSGEYQIYVRDRSPQARFTGKSYVLPKLGQEGIPVVTVNTPKVHVAIGRIGDRSLTPLLRGENFLAQLSGEEARKIARETGFSVWSGTLDTRIEQNREVTTAFPVMEAVGKLEPGVYVMTVQPEGVKTATAGDDTSDDNDYETRATQWFIVSDLGLTAISGDGGVVVLARSLATAKPIAGLDLKLVARNNEVLATLKTDAEGKAQFDPGLVRGTGGMAPGALVATDSAGDYSFLNLEQAALDLTDRGVKGRAAAGPLDAFLYAERGVYRSGESVHLTTVLKDARGSAVAGMPLTLVIQRPDGVEYKRVRVEDQGGGGRAYSLPLMAGAARGTWRARVYADVKGKAIGETTFLVEDYVPERLAVTLTPKSASVAPGQPAEIDVAADYLYGAPGAGLQVSGEVSVKLASEPAVPGLKGYAIGLEDETFETVSGEIEETATTNAAGKATVAATIPEANSTRPLEAKVILRVGEEGGRAVERSVTVPLKPAGSVLAVKKAFADSALTEGALAAFDIVAVTPEGARLARNGATWTLSRIDRNYQWYFTDGRWNFEGVKSVRKIADGTVDLTANGEPQRISVPMALGQYRFEVKGPSDLAPVSVNVTVGWSGDATATTPDLMETQLDKPRYAAGETMQVKLNARFAGSATLMVMADTIREIQRIEVPKDGATVQVPVKAEWGSGAYLVAIAHRPLDTQAQRMPGRAVGVAWFGIDGEGRALGLDIGTPQMARPRSTLSVPVKVAGLKAGEEAHLTIAAVDAGILNLTRYELPDATSYFFGQRLLGGDIRDLYGMLIDGMQGTRGAIRSGGDSSAAKLDGAPPTQEPMARFSGVVKVGADGIARADFDVPAFNGTVRVMAVAWSQSGVGQAQKDVIVRDPVVVAGTLPRFLNMGDASRFFVEIANVEGGPGKYTLDLDVRGPLVVAADATRREVDLAPGQKTSLVIPVKAGGLGTASLDLRLTGPNVDLTHSFNLTVLPGAPEVFHRSVRSLQPGQSVTLGVDALSEFLPQTGLLSVSAAPYGGLDVPALLGALDRYPYGCTEQTVSRALPLLYVNKLASAERLGIDPNVDERIRVAIDRVMARQDSNGSFGLWQAGGNEDMWLDAYVADFLTRARERNFAVADKAFAITLDRLRNYVANANEVQNGGEDLAYAVYVLARNGKPVMNDLKYLADTKLDAFKTPMARAQLAAALALLGDKGRANAIFTQAADQLAGMRMENVSRSDYGSKLRDSAGLMTLAAEANADRAVVQKAATQVSDARGQARFASTQEQAWMVLAAQALVNDAQAMQISVNGAAQQGPLYRSYLARTLEAQPVTVANAGQAPVQLVVTAAGNPITPEPALASGYGLERAMYTLKGQKTDATTVKQNERYVIVLKVTEPEAKFARLLLVDLLPAGFEIDNPALFEGGKEGFAWLKKDVEPANVEYRDDRFVAAFHRDGSTKAEFSVAYVVRAVSPGEYTQPPAVIEDMYRPERFGRTGYRQITVTPAR
jgi:uncharacterized protein YfaS (alpha-2-macroglobulin family)